MTSTTFDQFEQTLFSGSFDQDCQGRAILDQISNRWAVLILAALACRPYRFSALHGKVGGISQKMLSQNLKALGRLGMIERSVEATVPPQVTYALSELGRDFTGPLLALMQWINTNNDKLLTAQALHDIGSTQAQSGKVQSRKVQSGRRLPAY
jgi:DNA-binding HxlR family transcriptional regulator